MAKHFTVDEANALLPQVEKDIREALFLKHEMEAADKAVQAVTQRITMTGGVLVDRNAVASKKAARDASAAQLKEAIERVHEHGCVLKDLDIGLIDFMTLYKSDEVCLCWKLGEASIEWWHGAQEGFRGRKKIDQEFLENHRGDRPS